MSVRWALGRLRRGTQGTPSPVRRMRLRITGVAMVAVTAGLALMVACANLFNWNDMCGRVDSVMDYVVETDGDLAQLDYDYDAHPSMSGLAYEALLEMQYDACYFTVTLDADGDVAGSNMNSIVSVSDDQAAELAQGERDGGGSEGFKGSYRYRVVPGDGSAEGSDGSVTIFFLYTYSELQAFRAFRRASVVMGVVGLLAFAAVVVPFARTATRPVEEAQARQRRFVTDASHELRTPIAIIQSAVDVIEIEGGESEWTKSIHNQTRRLEDLTNKLVALAKADEGARSLAIADADLSQMALQIAEDFEPVSQDQSKPLSADIAQGVHCQADAGMLEQVLSILLDNAFKHSPDGAHVSLSVGEAEHGRGKGRARVAVTNDAEGVPAGEHPEFFGRFYKADASRAYEAAGGGHGIGLAVVRAVAQAHGGSVTATSDGSRVTVELLLP